MFKFGRQNEGVYVIAGLGNPGGEYENTRHNVGFRAVDDIARRFDVEIVKSKFGGKTADIRHAGKRIVLVKPQTYMNNSGDCVARVAGFYKLESERLIVIYDDIDIPVGTLRIRPIGGSGTHNGMRSIVDALGSGRFPRVRIGVGKPPDYFDLKDYVLTAFSVEEKPVAAQAVTAAAKAALDIVEFGIEKSMNLNNIYRKNSVKKEEDDDEVE
jgi:PTH1 family peptidyl-tRNA hydrolase